ncbi:Hypothetical_protein [Hexamita inflata]|uniref:Hypothetical_protein n=1 Tax=Hexamita inflata TaxID=28002 RepID=A0AA86PB70_9EUKA|nr:Hypothetical protein HINF_LOCUS21833 [Hexamita inflata]
MQPGTLLDLSPPWLQKGRKIKNLLLCELNWPGRGLRLRRSSRVLPLQAIPAVQPFINLQGSGCQHRKPLPGHCFYLVPAFVVILALFRRLLLLSVSSACSSGCCWAVLACLMTELGPPGALTALNLVLSLLLWRWSCLARRVAVALSYFYTVRLRFEPVLLAFRLLFELPPAPGLHLPSLSSLFAFGLAWRTLKVQLGKEIGGE